MVCSVSRTHSILRRSLRSTTSFAAAFTILPTTNGLNLQGKAVPHYQPVFDHAIGVALQTYATQRALEVQRRREEYLAFVATIFELP